jgi:hypothetical protein
MSRNPKTTSKRLDYLRVDGRFKGKDEYSNPNLKPYSTILTSAIRESSFNVNFMFASRDNGHEQKYICVKTPPVGRPWSRGITTTYHKSEGLVRGGQGVDKPRN